MSNNENASRAKEIVEGVKEVKEGKEKGTVDISSKQLASASSEIGSPFNPDHAYSKGSGEIGTPFDLGVGVGTGGANSVEAIEGKSNSTDTRNDSGVEILFKRIFEEARKESNQSKFTFSMIVQLLRIADDSNCIKESKEPPHCDKQFNCIREILEKWNVKKEKKKNYPTKYFLQLVITIHFSPFSTLISLMHKIDRRRGSDFESSQTNSKTFSHKVVYTLSKQLSFQFILISCNIAHDHSGNTDAEERFSIPFGRRKGEGWTLFSEKIL